MPVLWMESLPGVPSEQGRFIFSGRKKDRNDRGLEAGVKKTPRMASLSGSSLFDELLRPQHPFLPAWPSGLAYWVVLSIIWNAYVSRSCCCTTFSQYSYCAFPRRLSDGQESSCCAFPRRLSDCQESSYCAFPSRLSGGQESSNTKRLRSVAAILEMTLTFWYSLYLSSSRSSRSCHR